MTTIQKADYVFSVDTEKTKKYYETHTLCNCAYCRNFYAQAKDKFPKLSAFLSEFGVDIAKPDETLSVETDNAIDYISIDYTVCGSIASTGHNFEMNDHFPLSVVITNGFASPNEQTGRYFTISVENIKLPWELDEPRPEPCTPKANKNSNKILKKWNQTTGQPIRRPHFPYKKEHPHRCSFLLPNTYTYLIIVPGVLGAIPAALASSVSMCIARA